MDPLLQFMLALVIILIGAKGAGYISARLGQPAVLGELLAGLVLGPTVLDMLHWSFLEGPHLGESILHLAELGVLLLMFVAGLEVDLDALLHAGRISALGGVLGVVAPLGMGLLVAVPFGFNLEQSILIGLVLAATSVSISAQTMMELGVLRSRVGMALLGAAVVDDVLVILFFSVFAALVAGEGGGIGLILWVLFKMVAFLGVGIWVGFRFIPRLADRIDALPISEGTMAFAFVVTLLYAWAAEYLGGVATITGAFLAGLTFARTPIRHHIEAGMHTLAYAWLVPVFFVSIGLEVNALALGRGGVPFVLSIIVVAVLSKVLGSGLGALLGGFSTPDALRLGVGMTSRGEVGLIVATVGLTAGLIGEDIFASVVLMVLATTLITPLMLRALYPKPQQQPDTAGAPVD